MQTRFPRFGAFYPQMVYVDNTPRGGARVQADESWEEFDERIEQANVTHRKLSFTVMHDWVNLSPRHPDTELALFPPALGVEVGDTVSIDHYYGNDAEPTVGQQYGELTMRRIPLDHDSSKPAPAEIEVRADEIKPLLGRLLETIERPTNPLASYSEPGRFDQWLGGLMHLLKMSPPPAEEAAVGLSVHCNDLSEAGMNVPNHSRIDHIDIHLMRLLKEADSASFIERDEIAFFLAQLPTDYSQLLLDNRSGHLKTSVREAAPRLCAAVEEIWAENTVPFEGAVSVSQFLAGPQPKTLPIRDVLKQLSPLRNLGDGEGIVTRFADLVIRRFTPNS